MLTLIWIGLLGGTIAAVSPCILPVLPALFFGSGATRASLPVHPNAGPAGVGPAGPAGTARVGTAGVGPAESAGPEQSPPLRRPLLIIAGLVVSFSTFTLLGSLLISALHLPAGLLRWAGLAILTLVGLSLLFPRLESVLQRPFTRLPARRSPGAGNGFLLGLGLGTLYVPCAGPVLAAIALSGLTGRITGQSVVLTVAFAVGTAVPLVIFALAGQQIGAVLAGYRRRALIFRRAGGVVMVLLAIALTFNLTDPLQRSVPTYTQALQDAVESGDQARQALADAVGVPKVKVDAAPNPPSRGDAIAAPAADGPVVTCTAGAQELANCGAVPAFTGISRWFNTAGGAAQSADQLRGSVVLVDFWTFSCINCQHVQPYLNAWYARYRSAGLVVVGVHTPEFAFEKEATGLQQAISTQGIEYPVAMDNMGSTWSAFHNAYWPAEYLVDSSGTLRHTQFGEGGYRTSEILIRRLLLAAKPGIVLPPPVNPLE